ncbi:Bug family tripartite tricarboxylate transporter substrate binding protein [Rhodoplanes sp. Z2-YC6860]|uniref:Bug family tripartite tricarboxylate transporter substrate binding protein n=1 Tax=Rhodoplanes sp. Z2-YC6860 TaxID=674703 RepID=UPI000A78A77A|nr:tripartite tricarboxylate transporter substrate binding protein [Rhodoplanes sp. Z2-YC6860]
MRLSAWPLAALLAFGAVLPAAADDWPNRPVKAITTTSAGGLSDIFMRALGEELRQKWGQPLIIENRPGGAMNVGTRACADATPDGYTICITNADAILYNQFLYKKLPFDPETSVTPITNAFHLIHMLVVNSSLGVKNIDELCALSKAKPGTLNYLAPGAPMVLYMETLKKEKGCDWVRVPFRGGGEAVNAILSGTTPIGLFGEGNVVGNIRGGQMTPLVMLNNIKSPNFPDVPLLTDVGYNGPPSRSWYGIFAPAGTPKAVIDRVSKDIGEVINKPEFSERHLKARSLVPAANTPEQFAEDIKRERVVAEKVVKDAGFEPQ